MFVVTTGGIWWIKTGDRCTTFETDSTQSNGIIKGITELWMKYRHFFVRFSIEFDFVKYVQNMLLFALKTM